MGHSVEKRVNMARILIVEDEESVTRFLSQAISEAGHTVTTCDNGDEALIAGTNKDFDLILLDIMLPKLDGLSVCRSLRDAKVSIPILMLTAKDTINDKIAGLDAGADDYLVKPFVLNELLARVRALLRRCTRLEEEKAEILSSGDLILETGPRQVKLGGEVVNLSTTEFVLLEYMLRNQGRVLTREQLLEHVWQYDFSGDSNVLHVYISYLRKKIEREGSPKMIHTIRGVGYRLQSQE